MQAAIGPGLPRKILIVVNPLSGSYKAESFNKAVKALSDNGNCCFEIYYFKNPQELGDKVSRALSEGFHLFAAAGGDGTVSLLASHLQGRAIIGIIPLGTGNAIARVLKIPFSLESAIKVLSSSESVQEMDGMEVNGRLYLMSTSMGFTTSLVRHVKSRPKSSWGRLSYVFAAVSHFVHADVESVFFDIQIDGRNLRAKAAEVMVINTAPWGISNYKLPDSRIDDGKLEICIVRRGRIPDIIDTLIDIVLRERKAALKYIGQGKQINISSQKTLPVQADGDIVAETPIDVKVVYHAVRILVPADSIPATIPLKAGSLAEVQGGNAVLSS